MHRQEILEQVAKTMGVVPGWVNRMPDAQLEYVWAMEEWFFNDSRLTARDKALVAFGAATASHCPY